ncbi:PREDICTED: ankyrin repeat and IBR domain-containing protein 1-like isoform X2 [Nicrophorus vespilloides]|uniref:RBR-type E3 ubiquitin transferase n=1 Tax=Nicrophorus vespilloides TaxID=110193 RepID=A0ABM1M4V2_NICVS|nr:PREDICTED: ankyrin repeat and IBR domain-containing protein 1-like isoform X2 [Nicrophorus vespilloides]
MAKWSRELLLEKWMKDPIDCCQSAGVKPPSSVLNQTSFDSTVSTDSAKDSQPEIICEICCSNMPKNENCLQMSCKHSFCKCCWEIYLTTKIQEGDAHHILCPAYQCHILVPVDLIEKLVQPDIAKRYIQFDIKAFVESNKCIKWCPIAGCGRAVRFPEAEHPDNKNKSVPVTSHAVDCGNAHFFCWECLGEAHAPCGCNQWQEWQMKIAEVKPEELQASCSGTEEAANFLWLVTNAKPCPNCSSPIQKNEGCNHMKCSKCKYDFCWVCQESWKQHSSATGGYFRCNRFEAVHKADEKQGVLITEAVDRNNQMQEMSRFLHFYMRFRNHENSQKLEEPLLIGVRKKMEVLAKSLGLKETEALGAKGTIFIEEGVRELLKARRVLCGSYVYGYYLEDDGYNKTIFEFMQNELEEVTEKLSEMIDRPYLKTPKTVIIQTTMLTRRKRHEFIRAVAQGLIPPETPPAQRKAKKRRYLDIDISHTNAWLRDCQWPEYDSDAEECDIGYSDSLDAMKSKDHECSLKCTRHSCGNTDYNMELVIALEMSRLQMIEDRMKQAQAETESSKNNNVKSDVVDDQLKLAIQLSLQESAARFGKKLNADDVETTYQKTNADLTVDYFLKSLANHKIDLKNLEVGRIGGDGWNKRDKEFLFKPCNDNEDGRFRISDIHDKGFGFGFMDSDEDNDVRLKRSHSTGDLCVRKSGRTRIGMQRDEPRYHLDSDHSSQHDDKPEDVARKILALPSTSVRTKQLLLLHHTYPEEDYYQGQSSIEDTTTSDSINVDMEVCNILESVDEKTSFSEEDCKLYVNLTNHAKIKEVHKTEDISQPEENNQTPLASLKAKLCSAHLPKNKYLTRIAVTKSIGLISDQNKLQPPPQEIIRRNSDHAVKSPKQDTLVVEHKEQSKSTGFLIQPVQKSTNLRIKINPECPKINHLETDSSNEYESETGIPKSPTLYISGVSISRTPEPKSPGISIINGRQSRSSSLSVHMPLSTCSLNISTSSLNNNLSSEPFTPSLIRSTTPSISNSPNRSSNKENTKSKSANEPEREREMFCFPKSSTDGALSSVLHVQESNLSSDDFHEALFLLERSPKTRDSKRRKKIKKKDKLDERKEEISSAL